MAESQILDILYPKRESKKTLFGLSSFQILAYFRRGLFYTYLSVYMGQFLGLSMTLTSLYATLPMILSVFAQTFVWGRLSDRLQKRRFFIIMGEILAVVLIIVIYSIHRRQPTYQRSGIYLIIGLTILEFFWSMSNIGWSALVSDIYPPKMRSKKMALLSSIGGVGRIMGILVGGMFYDFFGNRYEGWGFYEGTLFYITSGVILLSILPMLLAPEGGRTSELKEMEEKFIAQNSASNSTTVQSPELLKQNWKLVFTLLILGLLTINIGRNSLAISLSNYLMLDNGFNLTSEGLSYIVNGRSVATILTGLAIGIFTKKIGAPKLLLLGAITGVLSLLILAFSPWISFIFVSSFFLGASEAMIVASSYQYASILIPYEIRGKAFGIYNASFFLSWGLGSSLITGPMIDRLIRGGLLEPLAFRYSFLVGAFIQLIGVGILLFLEVTRKKKGIHT